MNKSASAWDHFWFDSGSLPLAQLQRGLTCLVAAVWMSTLALNANTWWNEAGWQAAQLNQQLAVSTEGIWPARFRITPLWLTSSVTVVRWWAAAGIAASVLAAFNFYARVNLAIACVIVLGLAQRMTWSTGSLAPYLIALLGYLAIINWRVKSAWTNCFAARLIQVHTWLLVMAALVSQLAQSTWWQGQAVWWLVSHQHSVALTTEMLSGRLLLINLLTHGITLCTALAAFGLWPFMKEPTAMRRQLGLIGLAILCVAYALLSSQLLYGLALLVGGLSYWPWATATENANR